MSELNSCFKEAVCAEVQRVFDSCSDRDCIYELPVTLTDDSPVITDDMDIVRTRCAEVEATCISVDSVPFKSGYYAVDITYRFKITAEAFSKGFCKPQTGTILCGTALWNKRVILYGSEGNAKVFTSDQDLNPSPIGECDKNFSCCCKDASMPKASVYVVDPIALDTKFICVPANMPSAGHCPPDYDPFPCPPPCPCPKPIFADGEDLDGKPPRPCPPPCPCPCPPPCPPHRHYRRILTVSLGLFSIVQLSRPVSIVIPAYDYCIPCKDCSLTDSSEAPCDVFDRIDFPAEQFFPQPSSDATKYGCCKPADNITGSSTKCSCCSEKKCDCSD